MFLFFAYIPFVVIDATPLARLQQHPFLFTTNHTDRTFFLWRLNSAWPPHPGHSTILLRSEISSSMCAKLQTVAASNNRDHASHSLLLLLARATHIYFCSSHISRSWWITQSTQHHLRCCNSSLVVAFTSAVRFLKIFIASLLATLKVDMGIIPCQVIQKNGKMQPTSSDIDEIWQACRPRTFSPDQKQPNFWKLDKHSQSYKHFKFAHFILNCNSVMNFLWLTPSCLVQYISNISCQNNRITRGFACA